MDSQADAGASAAGGARREGRATTIARWIIPSMGNYVLAMLFLLLTLQSWRFLHDSDTGWHVRSGDWMIEHRQVLDHDVFSYTMQGQRWVDFEWLADALMSVIHHARGLAGLVGGSILLLAVTYVLLYVLLRSRGADLLTALVLTWLAASASMVHWLARPHLLSIPLALLLGVILDHHRRTRSRWIYALPVVVAVWANLHGAFVLTFPILAVYAAGVWAERAALGASWTRETRRLVLPYLVVGALSALAGLLTPYGAGVYVQVSEFMGNRALLAGIQEFRSPDFGTLDGQFIALIFILGAWAAARAAARGAFVEAGLVLLLGSLIFESERHITVAVMILLPMISAQLCRALTEAADRVGSGSSFWARRVAGLRAWYADMNRTDRRLSGRLIYALMLGAAFLAVANGNADSALATSFSPRRFPVRAVDWIERAGDSGPLSGRIFAHDQYGGYLIYRLAPRTKVFVDGRYHLYGRSPIPDQMDAVIEGDRSWREILDRWRVNWVLVPRDAPVARLLERSPAWTRAYADSTAWMFRR